SKAKVALTTGFFWGMLISEFLQYVYRTEFFHDTKSEPHVEEQLIASMYELISKYRVDFYEALIYVSKSPCFHQDCDPKCEVIDECLTNKACSKLLGKSYGTRYFFD